MGICEAPVYDFRSLARNVLMCLGDSLSSLSSLDYISEAYAERFWSSETRCLACRILGEEAESLFSEGCYPSKK